MYYDLIASLPLLRHFEQADHLPITPLRLSQRLKLLSPEHARQLAEVRPLVAWRPDRLLSRADAQLAAEYSALKSRPINAALADYAAFRMDQRTLLAALRRKHSGLDLPELGTTWGAGSWLHYIRTHWADSGFKLAHLYPWLNSANERLAAGDAKGVEQLLMDTAWRCLTRCAEQNMFGFEAVFSYVFKWDILCGWLACDADQGKTRFMDLIDKVTHVEKC